jgi:hypothetical protein
VGCILSVKEDCLIYLSIGRKNEGVGGDEFRGMNLSRCYLRNRVLRWYCVNITTIRAVRLGVSVGRRGDTMVQETGT